jgi:hypothetical protein
MPDDGVIDPSVRFFVSVAAEEFILESVRDDDIFSPLFSYFTVLS